MIKGKVILLAGLIIALAAVGSFSIVRWADNSPVSENTAVQERKPSPLPKGNWPFIVASAQGIYPKFIEGSINPPDVHVGDIQKFRIVVQSPSGVKSVTAEIETDKDTATVALARGENEVWEGEWTVRDTHEITYHTTFVAEDNGGNKNQMTIAWSDVCSILFSGDWTMSSNCTISSTEGVDSGNVTLSAGTLTLNAAFGWNPGKSLSISGGTLVIGAGGSLEQKYVYITDSDGDNFAAISYSIALAASQPGGYTRRSTSFGANDCYDLNNQANFGQTDYFDITGRDGTQSGNDGSNLNYDYNCSGAIETFSGLSLDSGRTCSSEGCH